MFEYKNKNFDFLFLIKATPTKIFEHYYTVKHYLFMIKKCGKLACTICYSSYYSPKNFTNCIIL